MAVIISCDGGALMAHRFPMAGLIERRRVITSRRQRSSSANIIRLEQRPGPESGGPGVKEDASDPSSAPPPRSHLQGRALHHGDNPAGERASA